MGPKTEVDSSIASRWGGALLAIGAIAYAVTVVLFVTIYGLPKGTGASGEITLANRVAHYQAHQTLAQGLWVAELVAAVLYAVAGFILQHRRRVRRHLPACVVWSIVSLGAVALVLMYPLMLGGLPTATSSSDLALFGAINSIASFLFNMGNVLVSFGLSGAFLVEAKPTGSVPGWLSLAGGVLFLVIGLAAIGLIAGVGALHALAPLGLLGYLLAAYLGYVIWRPQPREKTPAS
ncbi:MAG: hypothetical protein PVI37_11730 [Gammaproteobacteria bacterium]|jgi:hypothetical protein